MKNQKPINIHSLRGLTITASSVEIPSQPTKMKERREWRKVFHNRRCPDCEGKLSDVIAFKQLPIGYCKTCEEEKSL